LLPCKKHASERKAKRSGTILASMQEACQRKKSETLWHDSCFPCACLAACYTAQRPERRHLTRREKMLDFELDAGSGAAGTVVGGSGAPD